MKQLIKTMDEYADDLLKVAPSDDIKAFNKYVAEGKKVQVVKMLRKYRLIEGETD